MVKLPCRLQYHLTQITVYVFTELSVSSVWDTHATINKRSRTRIPGTYAEKMSSYRAGVDMEYVCIVERQPVFAADSLNGHDWPEWNLQ